jgi:hypothetical protein
MAFAKPIEDYASTIGSMRDQLNLRNGKQPGDPRKAARAILKLVDMSEPALRLPLGNDTVAVLRNKYDTSAEELEHWAEITKSTDFERLTVHLVTRSWTPCQISLAPARCSVGNPRSILTKEFA